MKMTFLFISLLTFIGAITFFTACSSSTQPTAENPVQGKVIKSGQINNLTVSLSSESGKVKNGEQELMLAFTDASGKAVDVGAASLNFHMPAMGSMGAMNNAATLTTTGTPGVYRGKVKIEMTGGWEMQITYEGPAGKGKTSIPVTAQ
ncbi:MAG: FixH family protein [Pyrinomonadaceae bacterium]